MQVGREQELQLIEASAASGDRRGINGLKRASSGPTMSQPQMFLANHPLEPVDRGNAGKRCRMASASVSRKATFLARWR